MVKRSFRRKRFCERHPRSESCKKKVDKKVKPYSGGKLNIDEICHNCSVSYYAKSARRFCKSHNKVWNQKTNSCRKKKKTKKTKKTKKQKGGALCVPCISPILSGLGVFGAGAAATGAVAAGVKGISMTKSKMSSSNGKIMREQSFDKVIKSHKKSSKKKTKRKENKLKFYIKQKNNVVTFKRNDEKKKKKVFNKSKDMKENIKKATEFYDKKIHYCVVKGYEKC
jgi:hypothetical protein